MVHEPLASVLRSGRDVFNAKFADARRKYPDLDAAAFHEFIRTTLDPLAQACTLPLEQLTTVIAAAYDVGLELTGEKMLGNDARGRWLANALGRIPAANWPLAAAAPEPLFAALSNAVHHLAKARSARVEEWIEHLAALAGRCPDLATLLKVGQVLAWRAGLAHLRSGALAVANTLPEALALSAVGAPESAAWPSLREQLERDVWLDPRSNQASKSRPLHVAAKVGAFRGLGGNFPQPPIVAALDDQLFVRSGEFCWLLIADVFGHSLHHASLAEFEGAKSGAGASTGVRVTAATVTANGQDIPNPAAGNMTSCAVLSHTIAITSSHSHAIILIAR